MLRATTHAIYNKKKHKINSCFCIHNILSVVPSLHSFCQIGNSGATSTMAAIVVVHVQGYYITIPENVTGSRSGLRLFVVHSLSQSLIQCCFWRRCGFLFDTCQIYLRYMSKQYTGKNVSQVILQPFRIIWCLQVMFR